MNRHVLVIMQSFISHRFLFIGNSGKSLKNWPSHLTTTGFLSAGLGVGDGYFHVFLKCWWVIFHLSRLAVWPYRKGRRKQQGTVAVIWTLEWCVPCSFCEHFPSFPVAMTTSPSILTRSRWRFAWSSLPVFHQQGGVVWFGVFFGCYLLLFSIPISKLDMEPFLSSWVFIPSWHAWPFSLLLS